MNKSTRLSYGNDIVLARSDKLMIVTNQWQGRAHVMVRSLRELEHEIDKNLDNFPDSLKHSFWEMVQNLVAEMRVPCILCHHFGTWRSADHFHVHICMQKESFAKFTAAKSGKPESYQAIVEKIMNKEKFLMERHLNEFKAKEIQELRKNPPAIDENNLAGETWGDFDIELDPVYPWVKFVPQEPQVFPRDPNEVRAKLEEYRTDAFAAMHGFAVEHKFTGYRIWLKLAGDAIGWNKGRAPEKPIYGIISVYTPEYYALRKDGMEWLNRYEQAAPDLLAIL